MSLFKSALLAMAAIAPAFAHITMSKPIPFGSPDSSPMTTASQFPCKFDIESNKVVKSVTDVKAGETMTFEFSGTAVHDGGSCQIAITSDKLPTKSSVWKVIHTVQGGCVGLGGATVPIEAVIPASVPNGEVSIAWTWFPVSSGGPEMYMNCAPLKVTGGADDSTAFTALPDLFVANIGGDCKAWGGDPFVVEIPNPGDSVETRPNTRSGGTLMTKPPTGSGCGASSGKAPSTDKPAPGTDKPAPAPGTDKPAPAPSTDKPTEPKEPAPPKDKESAPAPSAPAGTPIKSDGSAPTPSTSSGSAPAPSTSSGSAPAPSTGSSSTSAVSSSAPTSTSCSKSTPSAPSTAPSGGNGASCSSDGGMVCQGDSKFGLCSGGKVAVWQDVAPGTACVDGQIRARR